MEELKLGDLTQGKDRLEQLQRWEREGGGGGISLFAYGETGIGSKI
jgi:hypothetical protein